MSNTTLTPIRVQTDGLEINLQAFAVKDHPERHWFCFAYPDEQGQARALVRGDFVRTLTELPTEVTIDGTTVQTTLGRTETGNPKVSANLVVEREGAKMNVTFQVSHTGSGGFFVLAKAFRQGGGATVRKHF